MKQNRRFLLLFLMLGVAAISGGMGLKNIFEYSPSVGWAVGFLLFLTSSYFAVKLKQKNTD